MTQLHELVSTQLASLGEKLIFLIRQVESVVYMKSLYTATAELNLDNFVSEAITFLANFESEISEAQN